VSLLLVGLVLSSASTSGWRLFPSAGPSESGDSSTDPPGSTASTGPWSTGYTAKALALELQGLSLDGFFAASWKALLLRDPETVVAYGLAEVYGLDAPVLTDISDAYVRETYRMYNTVLEMLRQYGREALTPEEQISYDVYEWYLDDRARQQEFLYYDYPVTFFSTTAVHEQTMHFFTQWHPIRSRRDAEDSVARLGLVGAKFAQLLEGLKLREKAGIVAPRFVVEWTLPGVEEMAGAAATASPYYRNLKEKLDALRGPTGAEKRALLEAAEEAIQETILPPYRTLAGYLRGLVAVASTDDGVWRLPQRRRLLRLPLASLHHNRAYGRRGSPVGTRGVGPHPRRHAGHLRHAAQTGYESGDLIVPTEQVAWYVVWPGQATAYYVGMLKILELRQMALDRLGDRFDLKGFHDLVLGNGSLPLQVLERVVDGYIEGQKRR